MLTSSPSVVVAPRESDYESDSSGVECSSDGAARVAAVLVRDDPKVARLHARALGVTRSRSRALTDALHRNSWLVELWLGGNDFGDEGAAGLADALSRPHPALRRLGLDRNRVGPAGAAALADALRSPRCSLGTLDLGDNRVGPAGAASLSRALRTNESLTELGLCRNGVGDAGATELASALTVNRTLRRLKIGWNDLTEEGADVLSRTLEDTNDALTFLWMHPTGVFDPRTVQRVTRSLRRNREMKANDHDKGDRHKEEGVKIVAKSDHGGTVDHASERASTSFVSNNRKEDDGASASVGALTDILSRSDADDDKDVEYEQQKASSKSVPHDDAQRIEDHGRSVAARHQNHDRSTLSGSGHKRIHFHRDNDHAHHDDSGFRSSGTSHHSSVGGNHHGGRRGHHILESDSGGSSGQSHQHLDLAPRPARAAATADTTTTTTTTTTTRPRKKKTYRFKSSGNPSPVKARASPVKARTSSPPRTTRGRRYGRAATTEPRSRSTATVATTNVSFERISPPPRKTSPPPTRKHPPPSPPPPPSRKSPLPSRGPVPPSKSATVVAPSSSSSRRGSPHRRPAEISVPRTLPRREEHDDDDVAPLDDVDDDDRPSAIPDHAATSSSLERSSSLSSLQDRVVRAAADRAAKEEARRELRDSLAALDEELAEADRRLEKARREEEEVRRRREAEASLRQSRSKVAALEADLERARRQEREALETLGKNAARTTVPPNDDHDHDHDHDHDARGVSPLPPPRRGAIPQMPSFVSEITSDSALASTRNLVSKTKQ